MENAHEDPNAKPMFCATCERPTVMERVDRVYSAARTIAQNPGELVLRVPPSLPHSVKASLAVGTHFTHVNGDSIEAALEALAAKLADLAESDAVKAEHKSTMGR